MQAGQDDGSLTKSHGCSLIQSTHCEYRQQIVIPFLTLWEGSLIVGEYNHVNK